METFRIGWDLAAIWPHGPGLQARAGPGLVRGASLPPSHPDRLARFLAEHDLRSTGRVHRGESEPGTASEARTSDGPYVDFDTTFDEHYPGLVRYCHRLTGDRDAAEDIAQESMLRLFSHDVSGPGVGLRAWLFKTATHLVRDRYRVEENRKRLLAAHPVRPTEPDSAERRLEREETRAAARAALDSLAPRDREILLMRYSGFSYREIADAIGVAATSVGTLLARAERRFAEAASDAGEAA